MFFYDFVKVFETLRTFKSTTSCVCSRQAFTARSQHDARPIVIIRIVYKSRYESCFLMTLVDIECFPQQKVSASLLESFVWQSSGTEADARRIRPIY